MSRFTSGILPPWDGPLPQGTAPLGATLILPVPAGARALLDPALAADHLSGLHEMMQGVFGSDFEILLVPYGSLRPDEGELLRRLVKATQGRRAFRWSSHRHKGPGSAVQEGVLTSRGRWVMVGNLEHYYEPYFFLQALALLRKDPSLAGVRANRRLPDAEFLVPVKLLSMVYRRHLLGVLLMKVWSALFDIGTSDALSGAYVLRRDFALRAFGRLTCPWFLYGVELALFAKVNGLHLHDIPAHFFMEAEKSRLRLWGEIAKVLHWTFRLWIRVRRGEYRFLEGRGNRLTADDWGLSPGVNEGIFQLADLGILKRVSVLSGGRHAAYKLKELKKIPGIEFGLHFNLTCPEAGGLFSTPLSFFRAWMMAWIFGRRRMAEKVRWILKDQVRDLRRLGIRPVRLDGHHHVHAVPGLLGAVEDILKEAKIRSVRTPLHREGGSPGRWAVSLLGWSLRRVLRRSGFEPETFDYPVPSDFLRVNRLVARLNRSQGAEVLVHPAAWDDIAQTAPSDPLREQRAKEYQVLRLLALEKGTAFKGWSGKGWDP